MLKKFEKNKKSIVGIVVFIYAVLVVGLFFRNKLGIDLLDEPYYVSTFLQVLQGNRPLMQIWDGHTGYFLLAPFFAIYKFFVPSLNGVVLYHREISIIFSIIVAIFNSWLLYKKHDNNLAFLVMFPVCLVMPVLLLQYNCTSILFLCTACNLIYTADNKNKEGIRFLFAGICCGMACINFPTFSIVVILILVYVFINNRKAYRWSRSILYSFGVLLIAVLFFAWIFSNGSMEELMMAVNNIIDSPHTQYRGAINLRFIYRVYVKVIGRFVLREYMAVLVIYTISAIGINKFIEKEKQEMPLCILYGVYCLLSLFSNRSYGSFPAEIFYGFLVLIFFLNNKAFLKYIIFYIPIVFCTLIYSFTSDNQTVLGGVGVVENIIIFVILLFIYEKLIVLKGNNKSILQKKVAYCFIILSLIVAGYTLKFVRIYGDISIRNFTKDSIVREGLYAGIYTKPDKTEYIKSLEDFTKRKLATIDGIESKTLNVASLEPSVYLLSDAIVYTPWTYDYMYLFKGIYSSKPFTKYFDFYKKYPDIIFTDNYYNKDLYEDEKYEVMGYIKNNYNLYASEELAGGIKACIWVKK